MNGSTHVMSTCMMLGKLSLLTLLSVKLIILFQETFLMATTLESMPRASINCLQTPALLAARDRGIVARTSRSQS